ncbi:MAG: hypothetical protein HY288_12780 [Planctomycetia bacterium]|nr:hypothetical protein [Planctomycetia bacterium]
MSADQLGTTQPAVLQELLGYLNFSSGTPDPQFLRNLNELFRGIESGDTQCETSWRTAGHLLRTGLDSLARHSPAFQDVAQARAVLQLGLDEFPTRYREFHRDLLLHQSDAVLWRPFFFGRVFEALLQQGGPWEETDRIMESAIARLNDYIGHRPVAALRTAQRIEPYPHEWIRPIPLYVRGAGASVGRYQEVVERALTILRTTNPALLREAYFDPDLLDEMAFDPRAYDFDHPVNKRPNYHFGQWDPHHIDNQGRYRRFVLQQITLDVLLERVGQPGDLSPDELALEAAAVLCGTILMASGTSGNGPDAHDSTTTLSTLLPRIAAYRDRFYEQFVKKLDGGHGTRLRAEAVTGKQPLAAARQHLNQQLARRRAAQLEHVHLALLFARMGYPDAARHQAQIVPVAAARMVCEIQCRLTTAHLAIDEGNLPQASTMVAEMQDFLTRGIECGAIVDPWNILGFQGQFSLFPSPENSVPDHRLDQLIDLVEQIVSLHARLWSEAAARDDGPLQSDLSRRMVKLTGWWDQFAATSVQSVEAFSGAEAYDSAREVAEALKAFHQAGAAAGDIAFWRQRVAHFNSPKAYALVVNALWQKPDLIAAMALLMQWLSQAGVIPLKQGEYSFHALVDRWLSEVCLGGRQGVAIPLRAQERQSLVRKFFELLEANAEDFWQVPTLDLLGSSGFALDGGGEDVDSQQDEDESGLFSAAYDDVVYIDSTGDGVDADMLESGAPATDFELEDEARRVGERLAFLRTVAWLWKKAVLARSPNSSAPIPAETLERWLEQAADNEKRLLELLRNVDERRIPTPSASRDSLLEFDRRRGLKELLVEKVISTTIETADAQRSMRAALPAALGAAEHEAVLDDVLHAVLCGDRINVQQLWPQFLASLRPQPLLYVPLNKGGDPARLAKARALQQALRDLLQWLPRLGMLAETCQLIETARLMESANPVGPGAISEFDRLFAAGYEAIVESLVDISRDWPTSVEGPDKADNDLVECLEQVTEALLKQWLAHSRTLRLSVLEKVADDKPWQALVGFIERYGRDLFTQRFLNLGNLRAILHQGVDAWLAGVEQAPEAGEELRLLEDLGENLPRAEAVRHLGLVIEAIVESYTEYRDYNSTTTQSDRGDLVYTLLDFLRLRVHYDRVAWHLKPVLIAHSILVRRGRSGAAEMWRRALAERTAELADTLQSRGAELRKKYAMRLPTVTDRLAERFTRPLTIDRVRALIKPAMDEVRQRQNPTDPPGSAFELLEQETEELTQEPTGVGLDVPAWLLSLEQEVEQQRRAALHLDRPDESRLLLEQVKLTLEEAQRQLSGWELHPH